ncbi:hypothetical protein COV82_04790 [Candidatus Peregrinibacteria bacterium CG11_big_fil_rev_8_21_14_0_20_46_8]|nr:MAG: hypothetical protein COV82_04790 [Candidatus Peregrinibacteria bacterium CG11_big_fil_rev_8_21_14_0_20_46_8]
MTTLWIIFIFLHVVSLLFAIFALWRLYEYIKRYRFDESKYTMLFGFVHLHWIAAAYLVYAVIWTVASTILFITLNQ